jgi:outer membrane protein assembly factor BamA
MRLEMGTTGGSLEYQTALADLRRYFFWRPVTLALRGLHFGRYGTDAESPRLSPFYVGRDSLVRGYNLGDFDGSECTAVPGTAACPEFDRLIGSRVAVANLELRVPLFGPEEYGLFEVPAVPTELAVFVDAGTAWSDGQTPELRFEEETIERVPVVSAGVTARILLGGYVPLTFYYAKPFQRPEESWVFGFLIAPGW